MTKERADLPPSGLDKQWPHLLAPLFKVDCCISNLKVRHFLYSTLVTRLEALISVIVLTSSGLINSFTQRSISAGNQNPIFPKLPFC